MRRLTEHQIAVLEAMPRARASKWWRKPVGLSISARAACERKGLIHETLRGTIWTFELTDAGRAALQPTPTTEDKGREDRA
ncbi:MAG TPA: hypothetical protein VGU70_22425 [Methylobacterium sp.]|jgi:hypothetical protein|nr:hypothetical protein [Methylobacterium sp.]